MLRAALIFSRIHILRYLRMINQLGLFRVIIVLIIIGYGLKATLKPGMLQLQALAVLSLITSSHFNRKDHVLLNNLGLNRPGYFILFYILIVSPFLILYLLWPDFIAVLMLIAGIIVVSLITQPIHFQPKFSLPAFHFLPADAWEWRVGLRRNIWLVLIAYLLPVLFFRFDYIFPASILLIALITNSFLVNHEPMVMIEALMVSGKRFFVRKLMIQCALFLTLSVPLAVVSLILFPESIRPLILVLVNSLIVQVFAVSLKYAGYHPGHQNPFHMALVAPLNFAFIIPVFLPLPLIMSLVFGPKAIRQLNKIIG